MTEIVNIIDNLKFFICFKVDSQIENELEIKELIKFI